MPWARGTCKKTILAISIRRLVIYKLSFQESWRHNVPFLNSPRGGFSLNKGVLVGLPPPQSHPALVWGVRRSTHESHRASSARPEKGDIARNQALEIRGIQRQGISTKNLQNSCYFEQRLLSIPLNISTGGVEHTWSNAEHRSCVAQHECCLNSKLPTTTLPQSSALNRYAIIITIMLSASRGGCPSHTFGAFTSSVRTPFSTSAFLATISV